MVRPFRTCGICWTLIALAAAGCDGNTKVAAGVGAGAVKPTDLDLEGATILIKDGRVTDGAALERAINNGKKSRVDVDGDGKRDPIQIVETRDGDGRVYELRAIPSSKRKQKAADVAVPVAVIEVDPDQRRGEVAIVATYTPIVVGAADLRYRHVIPITVEGGIVITAHPFVHWCLVVDRPLFVGVYYLTVVEVVHSHHRHKKHKHKHKHR